MSMIKKTKKKTKKLLRSFNVSGACLGACMEFTLLAHSRDTNRTITDDLDTRRAGCDGDDDTEPMTALSDGWMEEGRGEV